jgi:hypothetical protein
MGNEYKMSLSLVQNAQVASALNAGGGGGGGTITAVNSSGNGSGITAVTTAGVVALTANLVAGAGINLTPGGGDSTITISAPGSAGGAIYFTQSTQAVTAKVAGSTAGSQATYPFLTWNAGLTAGHTYQLTVYFDGGVNATVTGGSGATSFSLSPYLTNIVSGAESQLPTLFGYGQSAVNSAPTGTLTNGTGASPVFDFVPIQFSVLYPALDTNVYLNMLVNNNSGGVADAIAWADPNGFPNQIVQIVAVDCGVTPP